MSSLKFKARQGHDILNWIRCDWIKGHFRASAEVCISNWLSAILVWVASEYHIVLQLKYDWIYLENPNLYIVMYAVILLLIPKTF